MKLIRNIVFITLPTLIILLVLLELFFRFIIPACDFPRGYFDSNENMYCLSNEPSSGIYTIGKFAEIKGKWHINNMHWNAPFDYYPVRNKKLIAVIGDSFIESLQVDNYKSYPNLLRKKLQKSYEVYSFGKSGAALSQYLHVSRYVTRKFNPDIIIINIVHNDFDESIRDFYPSYSYFLQVSKNGNDSIIEKKPIVNYSFVQFTYWKKIIYKSALFRYLYCNLKISEIAKNHNNNNGYEHNVQVINEDNNQKLIYKATDYLVCTIHSENLNKRVIFVFDAPRDDIYANTLSHSDLLWMHKMMKELCLKNNVEFIDLTTYMNEDYKINKRKFNSDLDGHWNEYGHKFIANIIYEYLLNDLK